MSKCRITGLGSKNIADAKVIKDADFSTVFENYTDAEGNEFVKIPTWYRRADKVVDGQLVDYTISTEPEEGFIPYSIFVAPDGRVLTYVCIGKWLASDASVNSVRKYRECFVPAEAREAARKHGEGYQLFDWQYLILLRDMLMADMNTVQVNDGSETLTTACGVHHLDYWCFVDGVAKTSRNRWAIAYDPAVYTDKPCEKENTVGYSVTDYAAPTADGAVKKLGYDAEHPFALFTAEVTRQGYYENYYWTLAGSRPFRCGVGGAGADYGAFYCYADYDWSGAYGVRLCYRPL